MAETGVVRKCLDRNRAGDYLKGASAYANVPLKAPVAGRDGEPGPALDKLATLTSRAFAACRGRRSLVL